MKQSFDDTKPIFLQVRELIEDQIVDGRLKEGEQAPSTNQLANFYKINHITVSKGISQLVDEGILFKKRGIGMFVAEGARQTLVEQRRKTFVEKHIRRLLEEADKLGIAEEELIELIRQGKGRDPQ